MNSSKLVKKMAFAGQFYEGIEALLKRDFSEMLDYASTQEKEEAELPVRAVILPHAGYVFSGKTAFRTLYTARNRVFSRALLIAPSHRASFSGLACSGYSEYQTPLGPLDVDGEAVKHLKSSDPTLIFSSEQIHEYEHSLEVELPLLKYFFEDIKIIPFICGRINKSNALELVQLLMPYWKDDVLWVISSDFTHYGKSFGYLPFTSDLHNNIEKLDMGAVEKILNFDLDGFVKYQEETRATICGEHPIMILLALLGKMSGTVNVKSRLVEYTTSGALTGDYNHCVSYAGINFSC
jgi:AmmeMemoRadiSam system protein B